MKIKINYLFQVIFNKLESANFSIGFGVIKISQFLTDHWKPIILFYFIVNSYSRLENTQTVFAQRLDKLETIQQQVESILIKVERIDERTSFVRPKNSKKDQ